MVIVSSKQSTISLMIDIRLKEEDPRFQAVIDNRATRRIESALLLPLY